MRTPRVTVIGAGAGGLAAAIDLAQVRAPRSRCWSGRRRPAARSVNCRSAEWDRCRSDGADDAMGV